MLNVAATTRSPVITCPRQVLQNTQIDLQYDFIQIHYSSMALGKQKYVATDIYCLIICSLYIRKFIKILTLMTTIANNVLSR